MMKLKNIIALIALGFFISADGQSGNLLIRDVMVYTAAGKPIEKGAVGITDGKISYVGEVSLAPTSGYDSIISYGGAHLYPGLIAMNTTLGLTEIDAVRATLDYREAGNMNPNVRSIIAYNAESEIVETVLANGVIFAQVCPRGGTISGSSSVVKLDGWNWEDAAIRIDEGVHMDWPKMFKRKGENDDPIAYEPDPEYDENLSAIKEFFAESKAYSLREYPIERDLKLEAMRGIFTGEKRLYIKADFIKEIREIIAFKRNLEIPKITIVGGYDAWMAADLLRENGISVMISRVNSLPKLAEDPVDQPFVLAKKLSDAKVKFCFQMDGDMEAMQNRNLPFNIGTAIAYGLSPDEALKAATINPAEMLGLNDRIGSLEVGKEASFVISAGDLFDMKSGIINALFIQGEKIDTTTEQERLYRKYAKRQGVTP